MVTQALLVALVQWFGDLVYSSYFQLLKRPIVLGTLTGLLLGDVATGAMVGGSLEVIYLGVVNIGGATSTDMGVSTTFGTALAILFNYPIPAAVALAIPIGYLGLVYWNVEMMIHALFVPLLDKYIAEDKLKQFSFLYYVEPAIVKTVPAVAVFLGINFGQEFLVGLVDKIPPFLLSAMSTVSSMLPAVGIGILLNFILDKKLVIYLLLGWALVSYLRVPTLFLAIIALFLAITDFYRDQEMMEQQTGPVVETDAQEDFLNG